MTNKDMTNVFEKISKMDINEPFVWRLKLSEADFHTISDCLKEKIDSYNRSYQNLLNNEKDISLWIIVYLAEWYKRCYKGDDKQNILSDISSENLKMIWEYSGIDISKYVYTFDENDQRHSWLYSIYVLGGLSIPLELGRKNINFLKNLCRLYHGEEVSGDVLYNSVDRSAAFVKSIEMQHSLFYFFREVLLGRIPYAQADIDNKNSLVNRLIERIKEANQESLGDKYKFEWLVTYISEFEYLRRRLKVVMNPEIAGEGLHSYILFDRVNQWGIKNPEQKKSIRIALRFMNNGVEIKPVDFENPLIVYSNTGNTETGFICWEQENYVILNDIPIEEITSVELWVSDMQGYQVKIQEQVVGPYMQLYKLPSEMNVWTSKKYSQYKTSVVFSDRWHIATKHQVAEEKRFRNRGEAISDIYSWSFINDKLDLVDREGNEITLYNRIGYNYIDVKLYLSEIAYVDGNTVKYINVEDDDWEGDNTILLLFDKYDIYVKHYEDKAGSVEDIKETYLDIETIEFKDRGRYVEWNEENQPLCGVNTIRVTANGTRLMCKVFYIPFKNIKELPTPIVRDINQHQIKYVNYDEKGNFTVEIYQDEIKYSSKPLVPTVPIKIGSENEYVVIDVYRPIKIQELLLNGSVYTYLGDGDRVEIPYILKDRFVINEFSQDGYYQYECRTIPSIYIEDIIHISKNRNAGYAALGNWDCVSTLVRDLNPLASENLYVILGDKKGSLDKILDNKVFYFWNYDCNTNPIKITRENYRNYENKKGVVFQDLSDPKDDSCCYPIINNEIDWDGNDIDNVDISCIKCFEIAMEYKTYFFIFEPLRDLEKNQYKEKIYKPLMTKRNGKLTYEEELALQRFAEEFGFNWNNIK